MRAEGVSKTATHGRAFKAVPGLTVIDPIIHKPKTIQKPEWHHMPLSRSWAASSSAALASLALPLLTCLVLTPRALASRQCCPRPLDAASSISDFNLTARLSTSHKSKDLKPKSPSPTPDCLLQPLLDAPQVAYAEHGPLALLQHQPVRYPLEDILVDPLGSVLKVKDHAALSNVVYGLP